MTLIYHHTYLQCQTGKNDDNNNNDHVVSQVAHKWRDLGVQLLRHNQQNKLNIIAVDHPSNIVKNAVNVSLKYGSTRLSMLA